VWLVYSVIADVCWQTNDEDYENALAAIALDIQKRQTRLSEIRLRERRATLLTTLYTLAVWVVYVSVWYMGAVPGPYHPRKLSKALAGAPVVIGPIMYASDYTRGRDRYSPTFPEYCSFGGSCRSGTRLLGTPKVLSRLTRRPGIQSDCACAEKTLKALLKQQREKVEEIKKKTNYYSTKNLIERYDDPSGSPLRRQMSPGHLRTMPPPGTPPPHQPLPPIGSPPVPVANSQLPRT
jgi:hypothetical protein